MKIAILETGHFQYALTQSEIFEGCEKIFFTLPHIKEDMHKYDPQLCNGKFFSIDNIAKQEQNIIDICKSEKIDLLLISPVFDSYASVLAIVKKLDCKKVITTHNINTWFHGRFWSINSYLDRINMRNILKRCDYIAVEDFIYSHLKKSDPKKYNEYNFLYIPFTIFHEKKGRKYSKEDTRLKIVLTGFINKDRRRYEDVIEVINYFAQKKANITFSFAGKPVGEYGLWVNKELDKANKYFPGITTYFSNSSTADEFRKEMETSDIVLSTSTKEFNGMGTTEYIGKTKPTAAIHDMMSYELPGLMPDHLEIPKNLEGSVYNFKNVEELKFILDELLHNPQKLIEWKDKAKLNSRKFTAKEIKKGLPF